MKHTIHSTRNTSGLSRRELLISTAGIVAVSALGTPITGAEASQALVVDGLDTSTFNEDFIDLLKTGGVDCVHMSVDTLATIADLYGLAYEKSDDIVITKTVTEIFAARDAGKIAVVMGSQVATNFEVALFAKNFTGSFKDMAKAVRDFKGIGIGVQGLCYNVTNVFGSGCLNHDGPLTRSGHRLVEEIHKQKIILDVGGHCGERTSLDAIELSSGVPIVCTHTNFAMLNPNPRAISDRLAVAIANTGGVIGITAISAFHNHNADTTRREMDQQATLDEHLDQYDHAKSLVGIDHVGLGPDFIWGWGPNSPMDPKDSAAFPPWAMAPGVQSTVKGFEDISMLPNLLTGLNKRGWSESELNKLLGENWLRVYKSVWGA